MNNEKHTIVLKIKPNTHAELNRIKTYMNTGKNTVSYVVEKIIEYVVNNNKLNEVFPQLKREE